MHVFLTLTFLISFTQSCFAENVTSIIDGKYINKLPISVTNIPESSKLELKLIIPDGFCQSGLVRRDSSGFYKKEYMLCQDLPQRFSDKMFYVFYSQGKSTGSAKDYMEAEKKYLTTKVCSGYRVIYEASYDHTDYSQADMIFSCSNVKNNQKVIMLTSFFAGQNDASALHYDIKIPIEDMEDFVINEMLNNINNGAISILKDGVEAYTAKCAKNYQAN